MGNSARPAWRRDGPRRPALSPPNPSLGRFSSEASGWGNRGRVLAGPGRGQNRPRGRPRARWISAGSGKRAAGLANPALFTDCAKPVPRSVHSRTGAAGKNRQGKPPIVKTGNLPLRQIFKLNAGGDYDSLTARRKPPQNLVPRRTVKTIHRTRRHPGAAQPVGGLRQAGFVFPCPVAPEDPFPRQMFSTGRTGRKNWR